MNISILSGTQASAKRAICRSNPSGLLRSPTPPVQCLSSCQDSWLYCCFFLHSLLLFFCRPFFFEVLCMSVCPVVVPSTPGSPDFPTDLGICFSYRSQSWICPTHPSPANLSVCRCFFLSHSPVRFRIVGLSAFTLRRPCWIHI